MPRARRAGTRITEEQAYRLASEYLRALGMLPHDLTIRVLYDARKADPAYRDRLAWIEAQPGYDASSIHLHGWLFPPDELPAVLGHEIGHLVGWSTFRWLEQQLPATCKEHVAELEEQQATRIGRVLAALPVEWR